MRELIGLVLLASCASTHETRAAPVPAACGPSHGDVQFTDEPIQGELVPPPSSPKPADIWDEVSFLDGCFGTWHIDFGWHVCFSRTEDGLVGIDTFVSLSAPTPGEHGALLITDIGGVLHVESSNSELGDHLSADAIRTAPHVIAFGIDGKDVLVLRRPDARGSLFATLASGHTIELTPWPPRSRGTSS